MPGDCVCRQGFGGSDCSQCALGYFGYPNCQPCPCNVAGTIDPDNCEGRCDCKVRSALVLVTFRHDIKHGIITFWRFYNLPLVWFNFRYLEN